MKNLLTYEDFINESYSKNNEKIDSEILIILENLESIKNELELEDFINSLHESTENNSYDDLSLEELEKLCEDAWIREFSDVNEDEDDDINAAVGQAKRSGAENSDKFKDKIGTVAAAAIGMMLLGPFGALAGLAIPLQSMIQKKIALKKALKDMPDGKKKDALRKKLKGLTKKELEIYNERAEERGKIAGINAAKKGETTPPKDASPEKQKGFATGLKLAAAAKEKSKKIEELPKDKKSEVMKKMEDKKAELDSIKAKDKEAMAKVEDIKKKAKK